MTRSIRRALCSIALALMVPAVVAAQRALHWDRLDVTAHLDAAGQLNVTEQQTMVFSGSWNGGERKFAVRPRQKLWLTGLSRYVGGSWRPMVEDSRLDSIDEYSWVDGKTLRWRSREPGDPPFDQTAIRYQIRYAQSGILLKEDDRYILSHDFAFADRDGPINRFVLRLTLDPSWAPLTELQREYTAGPLEPGQSFVLRLPLRYGGSQIPMALESARPPEIAIPVAVIFGFTIIAVAWLFVREQSYGRFAPVTTTVVDEAWVREHILKYPAEVVGAAWDEHVGPPEVVALIARMVSEGKLESDVVAASSASMTLRLKVDRSTLEGHERTLVDGLFFDGRMETSTEAVKSHYRTQGFDAAGSIRQELDAAVGRQLPSGKLPRGFRLETLLLFVCGVAMLIAAWSLEGFPTLVVVMTVVMVIVAFVGWVTGGIFRTHMHWGRRAALASLTPAFVLAAGLAGFLWFAAGSGSVELLPLSLLAVVTLGIALINSSINALKTRHPRAAIAVRKKLAAGRDYFIAELAKDNPALRDEWYPWVLAFGLGPQVDDWSSRRVATPSTSRHRPTGQTSTASSTSPTAWSGFGGGRSGGAGASASWAAAAEGMAASVPAISTGGSGGGGGSSSRSSRSSSSSSSSSGGGGGGGW